MTATTAPARPGPARLLATAAEVALGATGNAAYERTWAWRGRTWRLRNRGPAARMGRFGGGWDRELGLQLGPRGLRGTVIVNLWKSSLRVDPAKVAR
ncbi:hypothetical protein [Aeromicrobium sp. Leaf291]|uniref:hypothetical protein n=1 Tax=Aeromicrobium sp. Leaf291 TaxID=1736325 RepID=UPI0006F85E4C|nr:hypothetical protein [Aeromicrobium sp. Leaf291]KQP81595.1 hypothetical protein ASF35_16320 [Aeromicrobium sp. Leaf291]